MALTRFLPNPSDRMGILWSLLQIKDIIILEYGTSGTTAYAKKTYSMMGMDTSRLFSTGLDENVVVMGDSSSLEKKVIELDKQFAPKAIFIMASSVSSMTGSDLKGICNYLQNEVSAKLVVFTQGGFQGDYSSGLEHCYTSLVSNFAVNHYETENYYNILGVSAMDHTAKDDVLTVQNILFEQFHLTKNAVLSFETDLTKIETMSKAKVNIVLSYEGLKAAQILEERFHTPYVYGYPIGENAKEAWLSEIAIKINEAYTQHEVLAYKPMTKNVLIYANYDKALAIKQYMTQLGCTQIDTICVHKIKKQEGIRYIPTEKELIDLLKSTQNSIVFANTNFLDFVDCSNTTVNMELNPPKLGYELSQF